MGPARTLRIMVVGVGILGLVVAEGALARSGDEPAKPGTRTDQAPAAVAVNLPARSEASLKWGETANGLRAAVAIRAPILGRVAGPPELYLVVQNVSDVPVRLRDTVAAPTQREIVIRIEGRTQAIITFEKPTGVDVELQPRQAVFLHVFPPDQLASNGRTAGCLMAQDAIGDPKLRLQVRLAIDDAPVGAWKGRLSTGETDAATAQR